MTLDNVFDLTPLPGTKVASQTVQPPGSAPARPQSAASAATQAAVAAITHGGSEKTASASASPDALEKIASQVHGFTKTARAQEAATLGTIIADAFMSRLQDYEKVAAQHETRSDDSEAQAKVAQEMAARATYDRTVAAIEKTAAEHYVEGHRAVAELFT